MKQLPYFITLLGALIGWSVTLIADRVLKSPIVEYALTFPQPGVASLRVRNVTRDQPFNNLELAFVFPRMRSPTAGSLFAGECGQVIAEPTQPASVDNPAIIGSGGCTVRLPSPLRPGTEITYRLEYTMAADRSVVPRLELRNCPDNIQLAAASIETWVVAHEATILLLVLAGATLLAVIFAVALLVQSFRNPAAGVAEDPGNLGPE